MPGGSTAGWLEVTDLADDPHRVWPMVFGGRESRAPESPGVRL
jgi:hypothetical protein